MNRIRLAAGIALTLFAVSASAVDHTVTAFTSPNRFEPETLQINVGDTVTFVNGGGFHNVKSDTASVTDFRCADGCDADGGNGDPSSDAWQGTVAFPIAGSAPFYCEVHGSNGGGGMSGVITIVATGAPVIELDATDLAGSAEEGAATIVPFAISNTGDADLTWTADTAVTDCASPETVPWLSLAPSGGTILVGDPATTVDVTLDAATLVAGVYNATVCVGSNDLTAPLIGVPVEFTVTTVDTIFDNGFDP